MSFREFLQEANGTFSIYNIESGKIVRRFPTREAAEKFMGKQPKEYAQQYKIKEVK